MPSGAIPQNASCVVADWPLPCMPTAAVLQVVTRFIADWPPVNVHFRLHKEYDDLDTRDKALARFLKLPAAQDFGIQDCIALATTAARASSLDAFLVLCEGLPQLRAASGKLPVALLRPLYQLAIHKGWCRGFVYQ